MAHYAFLNDDNIVVQVIKGKDETELIDGLTPEVWYGNFMGQKCVRTSINGNIRFKYAGVGMSYNESLDAFIYPQCHPEAILDEVTCDWVCDNADHTVEVPE
jgi:hypothetical protein